MKQLTFNPLYAWALVATLVGGFVAFGFSLQAGVFILLFAAIAWYVWENPEEGFLLLLIALPILPMFKITQTIGTFTLIKDIIIFTLFFRLVVLPLLSRSLLYRRNIVLMPGMALIVWSIFAALRADSHILGLLRLRDIGLYIILYMAVLYLPSHSKEVMKRRLLWFSTGVGITLLAAIQQWFFAVDSAVLRFDPVRQIWIPRLSSTLAHPSIYGEYLVTALTLFASIVVSGISKKWKTLFTVACLIVLPAIFLTYSRAVWIGTAAAGGVMGAVYVAKKLHSRFSRPAVSQEHTKTAYKKRLGRPMVIILGLVIVAMAGFALVRYTPAGGLLRSIFDPTYGSNEERVEFLVRLIAPLSNTEAIVGRGLGDVTTQNFRAVDVTVLDIAEGDSRAVQLTKNTTLVDNQFLKTFVEMGIVGVGIYLWLYARITFIAIHRFFKANDSMQKIISLWALGFLAAFVIQALFIDIWDISPTNALFWIVVALASQNTSRKFDILTNKGY